MTQPTKAVEVLPEAGRPDTGKSLALAGGLNLEEIKSIGQVFHQSGMFRDNKSVAQAITKILAGQELSIPPMAAMRGIHIVDGNPQLSAALMGAKVKASGKYDYRIIHADDQKCEIKWLQRTPGGGWETIGDSKFTRAEADKIPSKEHGREIKLSGKSNWRSYGEDMLVARALSRGARRHCPDVFFGAVYAPGEAAPEQEDLPAPFIQQTPAGGYTPPRVAQLHDDEGSEESRSASSLAHEGAAHTPTDSVGDTSVGASGGTELFPPSQDELDALALDEQRHRDPTDEDVR